MASHERVESLRELLSISTPIHRWVYRPDGTMLYTSMEDEQQIAIFHRIFTITHTLQNIAESMAESRNPLVISINVGLFWAAAFEPDASEGAPLIHVFGPVFGAAVSREKMRKALAPWEKRLYEIGQKRRLLERFEQLSVLSYADLCKYALMLHFVLTGEKLTVSDVLSMRSSHIPENASAPLAPADRHRQWMAEEALLSMVRTGDLNFRGAIDQAAAMNLQWAEPAGLPLEQEIINQIIQTALCSRAAAEGGLSADTAYHLCSAYIRDIQHSRTPSDARHTGNIMYEDFVRRVHARRQDPQLSAEIQSSCDYILMHAEENLSLSVLADRAGYAPYYFARKFKKETGQSPLEYIRAAKIQRACLLLETTELSVTEIAEKLCYSSRTHFTDAFRLVMDISPADWRRKNRKP